MKGKLYIIGLGPGNLDNMTVRARQCIKECEVLVGYTVYIEQIEELSSGKEIIKKGMGQELERCKAAIEEAAKGRTVGVVCSGDSGLYGMAGLILELLGTAYEDSGLEVELVPGITSAISCASLLGAPIVEDFCTISLSDYMVDWEKIMLRLEKACEADFTIALYNPKSNARPDYLREAVTAAMRYRSEATPVGIVRNAYREGQAVTITTLGNINYDDVDMFCTVIIGNSSTRVLELKMVTSRGYKL